MSQEKSKTMPMQIFFGSGGGGGVKEVYYGICASSELVFLGGFFCRGSLWIIVGRCGIVVDRCGSLWVVPGFSNF